MRGCCVYFGDEGNEVVNLLCEQHFQLTAAWFTERVVEKANSVDMTASWFVNLNFQHQSMKFIYKMTPFPPYNGFV